MSRDEPDAREVDRVEALVTVLDPDRTDEFLRRCIMGSAWIAQIRTAEVGATVDARHPLDMIDERECTCLRLRLERPVPVEPGLRFRIANRDDPTLQAAGVVRPWSSVSR